MSKKIEFTLPTKPGADRVGLHHQVAGRIGSLIAQGNLPSGAVLPNEFLLGTEFGVSRTALREGIKVLASKGLVEVRRKTGTRVRPASDWNMLDPEVLGWLFSGGSLPTALADLLEVRRLIEPAAARIACERGSDSDLLKVEEAFAKMEAAVDDLSSSVEADLSFHLAILNATHNAFMLPFGALIQTALRTSFRFTSSNHTLYLHTLKLHRAVADAIRNRKGAAAEKAMLVVLDQTSDDIAEQAAQAAKNPPSSTVTRHPLHRSR